jgi:hypothetical protein
MVFLCWASVERIACFFDDGEENLHQGRGISVFLHLPRILTHFSDNNSDGSFYF